MPSTRSFGPGFPVPFAVKGRRVEQPADVADQDVVRGGADRPAPAMGRRRLPPRVDAGASAVPHPADPLHAVRPTRGRSSGRPSSPRPPPGQRAAGLQLIHLRVEQLVLHQQLADLGLQPTIVVIPGIRRPALQAGLGPQPEIARATARPAPP